MTDWKVNVAKYIKRVKNTKFIIDMRDWKVNIAKYKERVSTQ